MFNCEYRLFILLIVLCCAHARSTNPWNGDLQDLLNRLQTFRDATVRREHEFNQAKYLFEQERDQVRAQVDSQDVVRLNVGGQMISTRRATLLKVPNSLLHSIFNGNFEHIVQRDHDGSYFLDYNPLLFSHLLDQLRGLNPKEQPVFRPPSPASAKSYNEMLNALKLPVAPRQESDLVVFNVGGEKIETLRQNLLGSPASKLARLVSSDEKVPRDRFGRIFLNYNPRIFRILLNQLLHGKKLNEIQANDTLTSMDRTAFEKMLAELKEIRTTSTIASTVLSTTAKTTKKSNSRKKKPNKNA